MESGHPPDVVVEKAFGYSQVINPQVILRQARPHLVIDLPLPSPRLPILVFALVPVELATESTIVKLSSLRYILTGDQVKTTWNI